MWASHFLSPVFSRLLNTQRGCFILKRHYLYEWWLFMVLPVNVPFTCIIFVFVKQAFLSYCQSLPTDFHFRLATIIYAPSVRSFSPSWPITPLFPAVFGSGGVAIRAVLGERRGESTVGQNQVVLRHRYLSHPHELGSEWVSEWANEWAQWSTWVN